jgi:hypothetical protein
MLVKEQAPSGSSVRMRMQTKPSLLPDTEQSRLQPQGACIWQASLQLTTDEAGFDSMSHLVYFLGYGVAL